MKNFIFLFLCTFFLAHQLSAQVTLISHGDSWKYLDDGTNQNTAWRAINFDDAGWKTGNGKFGYGLSGLTTTVSYGPDEKEKYITTYFRKSISISNAASFTSFTFNAYREDGIVVYVNGSEVYRNNMPTGTISYTTVASASPANDGADPVTFNVASSFFTNETNVIAAEIHQKSRSSSDILFDLNLVGNGGNATTNPAPFVSSINRQSPGSPTTETTVVFRVTFSELVNSVDATDFSVFRVSGDVAGSVSSVTPQGVNGNEFEVTVSGITGNGELRLDLNASGTAITDADNQPITGGYNSGQTFIIQSAQPPGTVYGFAAISNIGPVSVSKHTGEKPQAKVWHHDGRWWCVLSGSDTKVFRLDGTTWTDVLTLTSSTGRADCWVVGNVVHILIFRGASTTSYLMSVEYDSNLKTYKLWSQRSSRVSVSFGSGVETATLAMDGANRLWIAACGTTDVSVRYSDYPYSSLSAAIRLANNVLDDDICAITTLPGKIGVLWSNQNTRRFYFRTHNDTDNPSTWSVEELPGVESVKDNIGLGLADDHLNIVRGSDGTLYCAAKTGFDRDGYPKLCLLVRRPSGTWDPLYPVTMGVGSTSGTRGIVVLNELMQRVKVVYCSIEEGGDILYKESPLSNIQFGEEKMLLDGNYANPTSTHQTYNNEVVILATNQSNSRAEGIIGYDNASAVPIASPFETEAEKPAGRPGLQAELFAWSGPSSGNGMIRFSLPQGGSYTLALYNMAGARLSVLSQGKTEASQRLVVPLDASRLASGVYLVRLQTANGIKAVKIVVNNNK